MGHTGRLIVDTLDDTLYDTIGAAPDSPPSDIRAAYLTRAKDLHPDRGGCTKTFQKLGAAYSVLSHPQSRRDYDRSLPNRRRLFIAVPNQRVGSLRAKQTHLGNQQVTWPRAAQQVFMTRTSNGYHQRPLCHGLRNSTRINSTTIGQAQLAGLQPRKFCVPRSNSIEEEQQVAQSLFVAADGPVGFSCFLYALLPSGYCSSLELLGRVLLYLLCAVLNCSTPRQPSRAAAPRLPSRAAAG